MKILVFTEGTLLMHKNGKGLPREEIVKQVEEKELSVKDYGSYVPVGNSVEKLNKWAEEADLYYLTSRTKPEEIEQIRLAIQNFNFPMGELVFRQNGESYKDVAERIVPDILIEDDCESIGGETEMVYPHIREDLKSKIKSVVVKEFSGIDNLPDKF